MSSIPASLTTRYPIQKLLPGQVEPEPQPQLISERFRQLDFSRETGAG